jgi:hypothetical protein
VHLGSAAIHESSATEWAEGLNTQHSKLLVGALILNFASVASHGRFPQAAGTSIFAPHRLGFLLSEWQEVDTSQNLTQY